MFVFFNFVCLIVNTSHLVFLGFSLMFPVRTLRFFIPRLKFSEAAVRIFAAQAGISQRSTWVRPLLGISTEFIIISQSRQQSYLQLLHNHCQRHNSTYAVQFVKIEISKNATNAIDEKIWEKKTEKATTSNNMNSLNTSKNELQSKKTSHFKTQKGNKNTKEFVFWFAFRTMLFVDARSQCWTKKHPVLLLGWIFAHTELLSELTRIFWIVEGPWHNTVYSETPHYRPTLCFAASKYFFELEKLMACIYILYHYTRLQKPIIHIYCISCIL